MEQQPALEVAPGGAEPVGVAGDAERVALDALEHAVRQHDPLARNIGQGADLDRHAAVWAHRDLDHAAAKDVVLRHECAQLPKERVGDGSFARHHLDVERLLHAVVGAAQQRRVAGRQPNDQKPRPDRTEAWNRPAPVLAFTKAANFGSGDFLSIDNQPRAAPAIDNLTLGR